MKTRSWTDPISRVTYTTSVDPLRVRLIEKCEPVLGRSYPTVWTLVAHPSSGPRYVRSMVLRAVVCKRRGHRKMRVLPGFCRRCYALMPTETYDVRRATR